MDSKIKRRAILISIGMILLVVIVAVSGNLSRLKNRFSEKEEEETTESEAPSQIASLTEEEAAGEDGETEDSGNYTKEGFAGSDPSLQVGDDCAPLCGRKLF